MASPNRSRLVRRIVYVLVGLVIIAFIVTRIIGKKTESNYITTKVTTGNIEQTVEVSGTTEVKTRYELQFLQSGRLSEIYVRAGDLVKAGNILASLENDDAEIQLESQKAALRITQANLAKSMAGPRKEEININKLKVDLAKVDLSSASDSQKNLLALARKAVDISALGLDQAQSNYYQAQNTLNFSINNKGLDHDQSQLNIYNAQLGVDQGRQDLQYTTSNGEQSLSQNKTSLVPRLQSLLQNYLTTLQLIDSSLGVNRSSVFGEAYYLFGNGNTQKIQDAKNLFVQTQNIVTIYQSQLQNLGNQPTSQQVDEAFSQAQSAYNALNSLALSTKDLLNMTPTNETFTFQELSQLIQQIDGTYQSTQQNYQTLLQSYQTLQGLQEKTFYNNNSGYNALQLKNNSKSAADLQYQQSQLSSQKKIDDAMNALQQSKISFNQAQENYNKAVLEHNRQADDVSRNIQRAKIGVLSANEQLKLLQAPQREVDLAPLKGQVDQSWNAVHLAEYRFEQTQLKAPADGYITKVNTQVGENVNMAQPLFTLDADGFFIKALISEADIIKIKVDDSVTLTFDALGTDKQFSGSVKEISPSESIVQGVIYYEIKVEFDPGQENIKPGMTANLIILTNSKSNVLTIPTRAVQYENNKPYVQLVKKGTDSQELLENQEITIGLEGSQNLEVTSGLTEGQEVVTFTKTAP